MKSKILFITKEEIEEMVSLLAEEIEHDYADEEITFICRLKSSFVFMADLSRKIRLKQCIDFVWMTPSKDSKTKIFKNSKKQDIQILKNISVDIRNKHVLIVDEIIEEGRTLLFLKNHLLRLNPKSLKTVSLLNKPHSREGLITPDYVGRTIDDRFMVGYGLDYEEKGRNYENIYHLMQ